MQIVVNLIASTLTAPIAALAAATIYFRLLAIKGDPAAAAPPPPASAPPPPPSPTEPPPPPGPPPAV